MRSKCIQVNLVGTYILTQPKHDEGKKLFQAYKLVVFLRQYLHAANIVSEHFSVAFKFRSNSSCLFCKDTAEKLFGKSSRNILDRIQFSKNEGYTHSTSKYWSPSGMSFKEFLNFQKTFKVTLCQKISGRLLCKFQFSVNIELSKYSRLDI